MKSTTIKTYPDLIKIPTFYERLEWLKTNSQIGVQTFGRSRWINQRFYASSEWSRIRREVFLRDGGWDLACPPVQIVGRPVVHHLNPITVEDIESWSPIVWHPDYLISTSLDTHNQIHYEFKQESQGKMIERTPDDQAPWKKSKWKEVDDARR